MEENPRHTEAKQWTKATWLVKVGLDMNPGKSFSCRPRSIAFLSQDQAEATLLGNLVASSLSSYSEIFKLSQWSWRNSNT